MEHDDLRKYEWLDLDEGDPVAIYESPKDQRKYFIQVGGEKITVFQDKGLSQPLGSISLALHEHEISPDNDEIVYHITHLSLEKCKRLGLGTQCLLAHRESVRCDLTAAPTHDLSKRNDGSHLTGDGPAFISEMRRLGIVSSDSSEGYDDYDDYDE